MNLAGGLWVDSSRHFEHPTLQQKDIKISTTTATTASSFTRTAESLFIDLAESVIGDLAKPELAEKYILKQKITGLNFAPCPPSSILTFEPEKQPQPPPHSVELTVEQPPVTADKSLSREHGRLRKRKLWRKTKNEMPHALQTVDEYLDLREEVWRVMKETRKKDNEKKRQKKMKK